MTAVSSLVLLVSGVGHALVTGLEGGLDHIDPFSGLTSRPEPTGDGQNFLVVGVDDRGELTKAERARYHLGGASCGCTDTLLLVHLSQDRERLSVVSIPRDTYVRLPPHTDPRTGEYHKALPAKINSAYAHGGPHLTVRTVEELTNVHIDHYLEVGFTSFIRTVEQLGGVTVCTPRPLKDDYSGLALPAGTSHLNGAEALAYVRARHIEGDANFGRMRRTQRFLAAAIDKATSSELLTDPARLSDVISTLLGSVRTDPGFGAEELLALGKAMRGLTPASSEFVSVPVADISHMVEGVGSTVRWDEQAATRLFEALREDRPLTRQAASEDEAKEGSGENERQRRATVVDIPPEQVRVQVENGTVRQGLAHRVANALNEAGFRTTGIPRNAKRQDHEQTLITYDPRWGRSARTLAAALPDAELRTEESRGPRMTITLGTDFTRLHPVRATGPGTENGAGHTSEFGAVTGEEVTCP